MEARLDRFGRIVLPKDVRDDFALEPGDVLLVRETSEGILLTPERNADSGTPFRVSEGVLVYGGAVAGELGDPVAADRAARDRHVRGRLKSRPAGRGPRRG